MIHDTRVIPTDGRAPVRASIRQMNGSSTARWDGEHAGRGRDELHQPPPYRGSRRRAAPDERFRRLDKDLDPGRT
jgi:hypothetical protein